MSKFVEKSTTKPERNTSETTKTATPEEAFHVNGDGAPRLNPGHHWETLPKEHRNAYNRIWRKWYKHHQPARPANRKEIFKQSNELIDADPAIQRYCIGIRNNPKNNGFLSKSSTSMIHLAVRDFLKFLNIPITNTAISELITKKKANPQDYSLEDQLELFANPESTKKLRIRRNEGAYILGIFKANRCKLQATSNTHIPTQRTKPISEGILKELWTKLDKRSQDLLLLQAYSGQRIKALATIPLEQIDMNVDKKYTILNIEAWQNKSRKRHETIVPKYVMTSILERCKLLNCKVPFPNYEQLWKDIRNFAKEYYGIRLTSHYLRKRFATIASETPMDVNQWDYLMGSKKTKGHDAEVYNLNSLDILIKNYETYLIHKLSLEQAPKDDQSPTTESTKSSLELLQETINQQAKQIETLTKLLAKNQ